MHQDMVKYIEGRTELLVPKDSLRLDYPPKEPAFFNPRGVESRDLSVIAYQTFCQIQSRPLTFSDILCGIGARGIRVAKETEIYKIYLNDINPNAIEIAKYNAENNGVSGKCLLSNDDANHFLTANRKEGNYFDIVDVDPFGTPAPYLEDAVKTAKKDGMVSLTATDTPVLCGLHPHVALRKYLGLSLHTEYCHEVGIRLLYSALAFSAARYDKGIKPLFCHSTRHYMRVYVQVRSGAEAGDESLKSIGYINHCPKCNDRTISNTPKPRCEACGAEVEYGGPLWIGRLFDVNFVKEMIKKAEELNFVKYRKMLNVAAEEVDGPPTYYLISMVCDRLQVNTPSIEEVVGKLREGGFYASRTILNSRAIRTNAPSRTVNEILLNLAKKR